MAIQTAFTRAAGVDVPLICGAMYPCSNPELVAAVSEAGGLGIIQPISLTYVHGHDFREGLRYIRRLTQKPVGMNVILESSSKVYLDRMRRYVDASLEEGVRFFVSSLGNPRWLCDTVHAAGGLVYHDRMSRWIDVALEEGVGFFVTSLGNPRWVVDRVASAGGVVYHDVTERRWAEKGLAGGVHGLIAVNNHAGGHAGGKSRQELLADLRDFGVPVICAGGVGNEADFVAALREGYDGVQIGTRFIATPECRASDAYKEAIVAATPADIVLTERITGVPVSVIETPYIRRLGLKAGPLARRLLRHPRTKHWMRSAYALRSLWQLKRGLTDGSRDYWQAGKSVAGVRTIEPTAAIVRRFADAWRADAGPARQASS